MADYGASDTSTTTLGTNQFPISDVYVPNVGLRATEGGPATTDAGGKASAPTSMYIKDGGDVTQGLSTDANTVASVMGRLTKIRDLLNATLTVGGTITEANSAAIKTDLDTLVALLDIGQENMANSLSVAIASDQSAVPVSGTFWQATQPVSGTVTANAGTNLNTSALALDTSVNGVIVAQGSTTSGEKGPMVQGAVTTAAPSYTTAQTSPLSLNAAGGLRVDGSGVTQPVSGTFWQATQPVSGTVSITANSAVNVAQIGGTATVTGGVAGLLAVAGPVASAGANADNPVKVGGVFNTTQPTVTTGQVVDAQTTARGAQIVATGVDTFNATINAALPAGTNVIGHVIADSGSTTAATQATASNLNAQVVGAVASAGANAGNPLKTGGAFNTTQPTVTTGQIVDAQYTARGAAIVSTGVDTFNVTVNTALPAGTNVIGHVINDASAAVIGHVIADSGSTTAVTGTVAVTESGTWTVQPGNTANTTPWVVTRVDGQKATYSASILGLAPITTAPTDIFTLTGSATKTIKVTRVSISGSTTLATQAVIPIAFVKRSTADTSGTSTAPTIVSHDSNNAAATATVLAYTVPPTTGTLVGVMRNFRTTLLLTPQTVTDFPVGMPYIEEFGMRPSQAPTLRGITQVFAINLNGIAVVAGWLFDISIEFTEE